MLHTQKIKRKESRHTSVKVITNINNKEREQEKKKRTESLQNSQNIMNKMRISTYLFIITLNALN